MKRTRTLIIFAVVTIAGAVAVWFWALRPLGFASYLSSPDATEIEVIRQYWPHRLVEPEWVTAADKFDRLMKWHIYETVTRLFVVGVLWFGIAGGVLYRFAQGRKQRPNKALERTASPLSVRASQEMVSAPCAQPAPPRPSLSSGRCYGGINA